MNYVLITPARNEETNIGRTIRSVMEQTVLPKRWIIVSDGSTDRTDDIVRSFCAAVPWIELIRMPEHRDRHFAAKVHSFNAGYERLKDDQYDIIGCLDADISFDKDYFEYLLKKYDEYPELGVAGTPFVEGTKQYDYRFTSIEHVSGACQLFRRECFEEIGGYVPLRGGGIDWTAVTTARMKGWQTRTFTDKTCMHHRKINSATSQGLMTWFKQGRKDYSLGGHPLWEVFRSIYQMTRRPYVVGGVFLLAGFVWSLAAMETRLISQDLIRFHRHEQMKRLRQMLTHPSYRAH